MNSLCVSTLGRHAVTCKRVALLRSMATPQAQCKRWNSAVAVDETRPVKNKGGRPRKGTEKNPPTPKVVERKLVGIRKKISTPTIDQKAPPFTPGWELPPIDTWRKHFVPFKDTISRAVIRDPESAKAVAEALVPEGSRDKIIIDASPGPGQLTRALMRLPKERIKKIIVLEYVYHYMPHLKVLEELDDRVQVYHLNANQWDSYRIISEAGALSDVETVDWNEVHPQLQIIMNLPSSMEGEQLISQLVRAIPDKQWLFRYGRVPMNFILTARMWERLTAPETTTTRCKVSIMAQASAELEQCLPYEILQPYNDHFHPQLAHAVNSEAAEAAGLKSGVGKSGVPHVCIRATPLAHPYIAAGDLNYWDYVVRKLFAQKATPLEKGINALGPGAKNIMPKLINASRTVSDTIDVKKNPRQFTINEWAVLVEAFKNWPFRPEDLGIDTFYMVSMHNR